MNIIDSHPTLTVHLVYNLMESSLLDNVTAYYFDHLKDFAAIEFGLAAVSVVTPKMISGAAGDIFFGTLVGCGIHATLSSLERAIYNRQPKDKLRDCYQHVGSLVDRVSSVAAMNNWRICKYVKRVIGSLAPNA